jgi:hypothetical protein
MNMKKGMGRRSFIKTSTLGLAGAGTMLSTGPLFAGQESTSETPKIKGYRTLGSTGFNVSDIGIAGRRVCILFPS